MTSTARVTHPHPSENLSNKCINCCANLHEKENQELPLPGAGGFYTLSCTSRIRLPLDPASVHEIPVGRALSAILNLKYLSRSSRSKLRHGNRNCENDKSSSSESDEEEDCGEGSLFLLLEDSPSLPICFVCHLVLNDLFRTYTEFNQLTNQNSFLGAKLAELEGAYKKASHSENASESENSSSKKIGINANDVEIKCEVFEEEDDLSEEMDEEYHQEQDQEEPEPEPRSPINQNQTSSYYPTLRTRAKSEVKSDSMLNLNSNPSSTHLLKSSPPKKARKRKGNHVDYTEYYAYFPDTATCRLCEEQVPRKRGNTTGLMVHLRNHHSIDLSNKLKATKMSEESNSNPGHSSSIPGIGISTEASIPVADLPTPLLPSTNSYEPHFPVPSHLHSQNEVGLNPHLETYIAYNNNYNVTHLPALPPPSLEDRRSCNVSSSSLDPFNSASGTTTGVDEVSEFEYGVLSSKLDRKGQLKIDYSKHFNFIIIDSGEEKAVCRICNKHVSRKNCNTTSMRSHLFNKHKLKRLGTLESEKVNHELFEGGDSGLVVAD